MDGSISVVETTGSSGSLNLGPELLMTLSGVTHKKQNNVQKVSKHLVAGALHWNSQGQHE